MTICSPGTNYYTGVILVSMGTFDEQEYERREKQSSSISTDSDDHRTLFEGHLEYSDNSLDELLTTSSEVKEARSTSHSPTDRMEE